MHHDLLHDPAKHETAPTTVTPRCNAHATESSDVLLRYVPVTLQGKNSVIQTFAFLDDGSSATFVEHDLVHELGLEGQHRPLCLKWTGGTRREEPDSMQVSLQVSALGGKTFQISKAHTVASLALPAQSLCVTDLLSRYDHLRGLPLTSYDHVRPRLLIGMDNCHLGREQNVAEGRIGEPIAAKTRLGWIVYGPGAVVPKTGWRDRGKGVSLEPVETSTVSFSKPCTEGPGWQEKNSKRFLTVARGSAGQFVKLGNTLIADALIPRSRWPRGRVLKVVVAKDRQVRRASVQTAQGVLERPATKIAVLDVQGKMYLPESKEREGI